MPMVLLNILLSRCWNNLQKTLFLSGYFLQYPFYIGIFYPEGESKSIQGTGWADRVAAGSWWIIHSFTCRRLVTAPISTRE
jgi:hypothetical protein